jgi:dephospho-CoA kinase
MSTEITFLISDDPDGGFTAKALGESIFTQADSIEALKVALRDAVRCHFSDEAKRPKMIRLHWVRDEVIAA